MLRASSRADAARPGARSSRPSGRSCPIAAPRSMNTPSSKWKPCCPTVASGACWRKYSRSANRRRWRPSGGESCGSAPGWNARQRCRRARHPRSRRRQSRSQSMLVTSGQSAPTRSAPLRSSLRRPAMTTASASSSRACRRKPTMRPSSCAACCMTSGPPGRGR